MKRAPVNGEISALIQLIAVAVGLLACESAPDPPAKPPDRHLPATMAEAINLIKYEWMDEHAREWVLRNPLHSFTLTLRFPIAGFASRSWPGFQDHYDILRDGNPDLLKSCGTENIEVCRDQIYEGVWKSVRADAPPDLVAKLDCHFQQIEDIGIDYYGFDKLRIGAVLDSIRSQIEGQPAARSQCGDELRIEIVDPPNLRCWTRSEFSQTQREPKDLEGLLVWLSWRNEFTLYHDPPTIELRFTERCAWPKRPDWFEDPVR